MAATGSDMDGLIGNAGASVQAEHALVERVRTGDVRAFELLYRRHAGRIHATCLRLCGNAGDAEEFTQKAFIRAWESLAGFRGESGFGTWLHRIAVNVVLADRRSTLRKTAKLQPAGAEPPSAAADADAGIGMDLERAIAALPDGAREVFVLHDVEGYGHGEIARIAGIAVGTSKAQLHRARTLLRKRLGS